MKFICFTYSKVVLIGNKQFANSCLDNFLIKTVVFLSNFEAISVVNCESELHKLSERYISHLFKPVKLTIVTCLKLS